MKKNGSSSAAKPKQRECIQPGGLTTTAERSWYIEPRKSNSSNTKAMTGAIIYICSPPNRDTGQTVSRANECCILRKSSRSPTDIVMRRKGLYPTMFLQPANPREGNGSSVARGITRTQNDHRSRGKQDRAKKTIDSSNIDTRRSTTWNFLN